MTKEKLFGKLNKVKTTDRILLITHTDLDGSGPAIILNKYFDNVTVRHCTNTAMSFMVRDAVIKDLESGEFDFVIACDISVNGEDAKEIEASNHRNHFVLIDHHTTAEDLNKYDWAAVETWLLEDSFRAPLYAGMSDDKEKHSSGTSLLYDYLDYIGIIKDAEPEFKAFVHMIATYDTWDWKNTFTDAEICDDLNKIFQVYGSEVFDEIYTKRFTTMNETEIKMFNEQNDLLLKAERIKLETFLKYCWKGYQTGSIKIGEKYYSMCLFSGNSYMNEVFMDMKEHWPDRDLYIICYGTGIALRKTDSNETINVGEIAKEFGGGGHAGAAGFKIPLDLQIGYIQAAIAGSTVYIDH